MRVKALHAIFAAHLLFPFAAARYACLMAATHFAKASFIAAISQPYYSVPHRKAAGACSYLKRRLS
jgi:hypothetical protein